MGLPQRATRQRSGGTRIINNIQIAPPLRESGINCSATRQNKKKSPEGHTSTDDGKVTDWASPKQSRRKKRMKSDDAGRNRINVDIRYRENLNERVNENPRRRVPRTAAVAIRGNSSDFSYAEAIKRARTDISVEQLGIKNSRIRRALNGGLIIEIPGPDNDKKAVTR